MKRTSLLLITFCMAGALWAQSSKLPLIGISGTHASDGVVEAMEMKGNPHIFSVQFHPEGPTSHGLDHFFPIFTYLIEISTKR